MTQYLTTAQGMPKDTEKALLARAREFIWDNDGKTQISTDLLCAPIEVGGKNMLNLTHRNDAIELMWLKGLLKPPNKRPTWAFFADALIAHNARPAPSVSTNTKINSFLQTWKPLTRKLPPSIQRMLKVAKTYHVKWDACRIPPNIARQLPIWFHLGATPHLNKLNNYYYANCLRDNHRVSTVGDIENMIQQTSPNHKNRKECDCTLCTHDRTQYNCPKPFRCRKTATDILTCILPKWSPLTNIIKDAPDLTPDQLVSNDQAIKKKENVLFNPALPTMSSIEDGFRAFRLAQTCEQPVNQQ